MMELDTNESKPVFIAQRCVVCNGFGTLKYGTITCKACGGKGFITINQLTGEVVSVEEGGLNGDL